jgi:hypothetical protein
MKQITIFLTVFIIGMNCFCQQTENLQSIQKTDYLRKSRNQKTAAWILLGGGIAMTITGAVIYNHAYNKAAEEDPFGTLVSLGTNVNPGGAVLATVGLLSTVSSIPLFIASGKNKRRASSVSTSFKMENAQVIQRASFVKRSYPALSLRIGL